MTIRVAPMLFPLDPHIRYVAVNRNGAITEMEQQAQWPSYNPPETDRMEELIVNPVVLEATRRRGDLDLEGVRYVIIRYGNQYQVVFPFDVGHVSVGVELAADIGGVAQRVAETLSVLSKS